MKPTLLSIFILGCLYMLTAFVLWDLSWIKDIADWHALVRLYLGANILVVIGSVFGSKLLWKSFYENN